MDTIYCKRWHSVDNNSIEMHHVIRTVINGVGLICTFHVRITEHFHITTAILTTAEDQGSEFALNSRSVNGFSIDTGIFKEIVDCGSLIMIPKVDSNGPAANSKVAANTGWEFGEDFSRTGSDTNRIAGETPVVPMSQADGGSEYEGWLGFDASEAMVGRQFPINGVITDDGEGGQLPFNGSFFLDGSKVVAERIGRASIRRCVNPGSLDSDGRIQRLLCESA